MAVISRLYILFLFVFLLFYAEKSAAQTTEFSGVVSNSLVYADEDQSSMYAQVRYVPQILMNLSLKRDRTFDVFLSGDFNFSALKFFGNEGVNTDKQADLYRAWIRLSAENYEVRLGLQKINFGPAMFFRPLMWFDRIDPRDPMKMTKGVYGALVRYYFINNTSIWMWGLLGNKETKGWELIPSDKRKIEFGGRIESPLSRGEIGFALNRRTMKIPDSYAAVINEQQEVQWNNSALETKFGGDIRLDLGVGLWSEFSLIKKDVDMSLRYQKMFTVGMDYTFAIGNGIHTAAEFFYQTFSRNISESEFPVKFSALYSDYPVSMIGNISAMIFYDCDNGYNMFSGKGVQIMFLFHH